jgi:RNA polymerase sigma factor (sigma-70 family)
MPRRSQSGLLDRFRAAFLQEGAFQSDGQLLEDYVSRGNAIAFEALVRRHGPMVLRVCQRFRLNTHDAEDAFQATFLVLVRKAASIVPRDRVGAWLHGTACLAAQKARAVISRRQAREKQVRIMPEACAVVKGLWDDLEPFLDQELRRLPEKYRLTVVLCDLEGKTRKEAAQQLGWPEGTVAGRLARARSLLARRLRRHSLPVSGGVLAAVLAEKAASAAMPTPLLLQTCQAAASFAAGPGASASIVSTPVTALTKGVLKTMFMAKLKILAALALIIALAGGGISLWQRDGSTSDLLQAATKADAPTSAPKDPLQNNTLVVKNLVLKAVNVDQQTITAVTDSHCAVLKVRAPKEGQPKAGGKVDDKIILQLQNAKIKIDGVQLDGQMLLHLEGGDLQLDGLKLELQNQPQTKLESLPIAKGSRLFIKNKPAKFSELKPGMHVTLVLGMEGEQLVVKGLKAE